MRLRIIYEADDPRLVPFSHIQPYEFLPEVEVAIKQLVIKTNLIDELDIKNELIKVDQVLRIWKSMRPIEFHKVERHSSDFDDKRRIIWKLTINDTDMCFLELLPDGYDNVDDPYLSVDYYGEYGHNDSCGLHLDASPIEIVRSIKTCIDHIRATGERRAAYSDLPGGRDEAEAAWGRGESPKWPPPPPRKPIEWPPE